MAGKNQVTLTLAGDSTSLEKAFDNVGSAAGSMSTKVEDTASSFDKADKAAGSMEKAGRGLRDAINGGADAMKAGGAILRGEFSAETFLTAGAAVADLSGAFGDLLLPLGKATAGFVAQKAGMIAHAVASGTVNIATKAWAAGQWLLNAALTANPIGLIVVAVGLLVGAIVWIATKTTWFQDIWKVSWTFIKNTAVNVWDWLKGLPSRLGAVFSSVASFITAPFRAAFNFISDAWNNTIGSLSWTVPGWVPFIGGSTISAPQLPRFHAGVGTVPGPPGSEVMAVLQAGERVSAGANGGTDVVIRGDGSRLADLLLELLQDAISVRGGNVQVVLGS